MLRRTGLYLLFFCILPAYGEAVNLSGTVQNKNNKPIAGAFITLLGKGLKDTADAMGRFAIVDGVNVLPRPGAVPRREAVVLTGSGIRLTLAKPADVEVALFDVKGALLGRPVNGPVSSGLYRLDIAPRAAAAVVAVRVSIDGRVSVFRSLSLQAPNALSALPGAAKTAGTRGLSKVESGVDSLKVTASGYAPKVQTIASFQGTVNVTLDSSTLEKFSFFVTSLKALQELSGKTNGFGGDFRFGKTGQGAGLKGADSICECIAERSMPGSKAKIWRAFLSAAKDESGKAVNAIDRIGQGPWYDRLGRVVSPDIKGLLADRPNADALIKNDLPNEDGVPNHKPDPNKATADNHHMVTGTGSDGKLYVKGSTSTTCNDWTSKAADGGKPYGGLSWPRAGGITGLGSSHWMAGLELCGCRDSIAIVEAGGPPKNCDFIGGGGGYGGFYCFALTP